MLARFPGAPVFRSLTAILFYRKDFGTLLAFRLGKLPHRLITIKSVLV